MTDHKEFPSLDGWETTRDTLSAYAKIVGAVPRALAEPHPKWWHISLKVREQGLTTDEIPHPERSDETFRVQLNLQNHNIEILTSAGDSRSTSMTLGLSATRMGDEVIGLLNELGIAVDLDRPKFDSDDPRVYDTEKAGAYLIALRSIASVMEKQKAGLEGETGPVQLWPHHFDLAFEWFGTRIETYEEEGEMVEYPSQINVGFSPGDGGHPGAYFYSNPWPFDEGLVENDLPSGARWYTEGWNGTLLAYADLADKEVAGARLLAYYRAVYEIASPGLIV